MTDKIYTDTPELHSADELVMYMHESGYIRNCFIKYAYAEDRNAATPDEAEAFFTEQLLMCKDKMFDLYRESGINRARAYAYGVIVTRGLRSNRSTWWRLYRKHQRESLDIDELF